MRILHTVASLQPDTGGPARSVPGLANALADQGAEVHVWSPNVPGDSSDLTKFTLHRGTLEEALGKIQGLDLIHDHGLWLPVNHRVAIASRQRNIPRVVSPRGMLEPWALNHKKWKKRAAWWLYQKKDLRSAGALHATAHSEAGQFQRLGLKNPIHTIPNGVDLPPPSDLRPLPSNRKTVLFLSRIHPKKGLPMLVEAWAKLKPVGWQMLVAGPDENGHRLEIERQVEKTGLSDQWRFTGALEGEAKRQAFSQADLFILPTYSENFGIAVAEALASGIPVITTTGTPWQGLENHGCGWWVKPEMGTLAKTLGEAMALSDSARHEMGARGISWMKQDFTWEGIATKMLAAYQQVLSRP